MLQSVLTDKDVRIDFPQDENENEKKIYAHKLQKFYRLTRRIKKARNSTL